MSTTITAEEFARMASPPDGSIQELVRGEIITMPPPKPRYGACCVLVTIIVGSYVKQHKLGICCSNDTGVQTEDDPDTGRGLDFGFWSHERIAQVPDGYFQIGPDLAAEVLSPSNRRGQVHDKIIEYSGRGTRMIWIVDPEDRTVTVYRGPDGGRLFHENATLDGEDVLPGFSCRVADLMP